MRILVHLEGKTLRFLQVVSTDIRRFLVIYSGEKIKSKLFCTSFRGLHKLI